MDNTLVYPKGSILTLTSGEYSDYGLCGFLVTVKDCDLRALAAEHKASYKSRNEWDQADPASFVAWLVVNGHAMPVDTSEVHIGSYGRLEL